MKEKIKSLFARLGKNLKRKSRLFYMGLVSLIVLLVSSIALILVFISFENKDYDETENVFFSGIIIEPTVFDDYRDNIDFINYDSISKERRDFIELYSIQNPLTRYDSIINTLKSYRYNHGNKEDEIITVESQYEVTNTSITYTATFKLNEYINEKMISDYEREFSFVFRTPHNSNGLFTITNADGNSASKKLKSQDIDYVKAFQLFEIENRGVLPESEKANDIYRLYKISTSHFPLSISFTAKNIPRQSYFDNTEINLISVFDSKGKQVFAIKNGVKYNDKVEVLNMEPVENIITQNNLNNDVVLENQPYKNLYMDNQKLSVDIWDTVDRYTFPVNQSESNIYLKYRTKDLELQRELYSVILSILIGAALSGFLSAVLNRKS